LEAVLSPEFEPGIPGIPGIPPVGIEPGIPGMPPAGDGDPGEGKPALEPAEPDDEELGDDGIPLLPELDGEGMPPAGDGVPPLLDEGEPLGMEGMPLELDDEVEEDWQPANTKPLINATNRGYFNLGA